MVIETNPSSNNLLLSVVIPTYNRANELNRCLKSVLAESGDFFEVLVGDNASPDHTQEIIKSFASDPRLRSYRNESNIGGAANVLKIIKSAHGHYIFILTDDDYLLADALNKVTAIIKTYPEVGYILSHLPTVDERTNKIVHNHHTFNENKFAQPTIPTMATVVYSTWVLSRQILKRDAIDWENWEDYKSNVYFPIIVAGKILLKYPSYYLAENLVMHTQFNKVFWEEAGRNELEIEFRLASDMYKCMRAILAHHDSTPEAVLALHQWEINTFKTYLYRSPRGFYDLAKSLGIREGLKKIFESFELNKAQRVELGLFPFKILFFRAWFNLKYLLSKLPTPVVDKLKNLRPRTS